MVEAYLNALEMCCFEMSEAFKGLADENVWKRPADGLLSVGELAGHIAYWEAIRLAGEGEDLSKCRITSPLIHRHFRYHPSTLSSEIPETALALTGEQVLSELLHVHKESVASVKALNPDPASKIPGDENGFTYGEFLKYLVFHFAYHTGQIYTARHLLGEETPDN